MKSDFKMSQSTREWLKNAKRDFDPQKHISIGKGESTLLRGKMDAFCASPFYVKKPASRAKET